MKLRRNIVLVLLSGSLSLLSVVLLADIAMPGPRLTSFYPLGALPRPAPSWLVYLLVFGALSGVIIALFASLLGWYPRLGIHGISLIDLIHELPVVLKPFGQDFSYSFIARPRVGFIGIVVTIVGTFCVMLIWPDNNTVAEKAGVGLGLAGLLFGVLGYNVAVRVDKGIRDSITDFRDFLKKVSEILGEEILYDSRSGNFGSQQRRASAPSLSLEPGGNPDLILLLWFPYYGLTKDFNGVGQKIGKQLMDIQEGDFCAYLIAAKDALTQMLYFDSRYSDKDKRYCSDTLKKLAAALQGKEFEDWDPVIRRVIPLEDGQASCDENGEVEKCVRALKKILASDGSHPWWVVKREDNQKLMNGLVQLVWTPKKAAIVFMPPEQVSANIVEKLEGFASNEGEATRQGQNRFKADPGEPYKCSGFVTEDPFMNKMIRDMVRIRFGF